MRNLMVFLLALGALGMFVWRGGHFSPHAPGVSKLIREDSYTSEFLRRCGPPAPDRKPVVLKMLYGDQQEKFLVEAAARFGHDCPNIQLQLAWSSSLAAVELLGSAEHRPRLWAPSSDLALRYADYLLRQKNQQVPFDISKRVSLFTSPLVWLINDSRYQVLREILAAKHDEGQWLEAGCAMVSRTVASQPTDRSQMLPGSWADWLASARPAVAAPPPAPESRRRRAALLELPPDPLAAVLKDWGPVCLPHPSPARSIAGLEALVLLAYDFVLPPRTRPTHPSAAEFKAAIREQRQSLTSWLQRCEAGIPSFSASPQALAKDLLSFGSRRYDGVITYEHMTIPILQQVLNNKDQMEVIRVMVPDVTLWSDHPVVELEHSGPTNEAEHIAAEKWKQYLLSREVQVQAVQYGFRPGQTDFTVDGFSSLDNPFDRLTSLGISLHLSRKEPPPLDGEALAELIQIWRSATGGI